MGKEMIKISSYSQRQAGLEAIIFKCWHWGPSMRSGNYILNKEFMALIKDAGWNPINCLELTAQSYSLPPMLIQLCNGVLTASYGEGASRRPHWGKELLFPYTWVTSYHPMGLLGYVPTRWLAHIWADPESMAKPGEGHIILVAPLPLPAPSQWPWS